MIGLILPVCEQIESLLARHGSFRAVQKFRLYTFGLYCMRDNVPPRVVEKICFGIMRTETRLRQLAQREEDLRERYSALKQKASSREDKKQLSEWLQELEEIPKKYWFIERDLYQQEATLPRGGFVRAYKLWRSNPKWYLHPELANDCAGKGGCCGRDCGCCESRGRAMNRPGSAGHCTVDCGCCARSRGFDIDRKDVLKAQEISLSALDNQTRRAYSSRILQAYFFGVGAQADAAPRWIREHEVRKAV